MTESYPRDNRDNQETTGEQSGQTESSMGRIAVESVSDDSENEPRQYRILELEDPDLSFVMRRSYLRNTYRLTEKIQSTKPEYVIFLDKSGRPVSWLENELYDDFVEAASEDEQPWPKPQTLFLNIDREHWREHTGGKEFGSGQVDVKDIDSRVIDDLRSILLESNPANAQEAVTDIQSMIDGSRVLIVDEVKFTGDTLKIAEKLLKAAFPDTQFDTHHWMTSPKAADPNAKSTGLPDVPVWYKSDAEWGRGVANRNLDKSARSHSWRQRKGGLFLSSRFDKPDPASNQLRKEIKSLAGEYRQGIYGTVTY